MCEPSGDRARRVGIHRSLAEKATSKRVTCFGAGGVLKRAQPRMAAAAIPTTKLTAAQRIRSRPRPRAAPTPACGPASTIHSNSRATSPALCQRWSGSLAKHRRMTCSSATGESGVTLETGSGFADMMAEIKLAWLLPSNAFLPVTIS